MIRAWCAIAALLVAIGATMPTTALAQNLEAGKSPGQLFTNTCTACHRSPRGLLRTVPPGSLPGFLREHYTTSREMAQQLSGFLISNGAADTRGRPQEARQQPPGTEPPRPLRPGEQDPAVRSRPDEASQPPRPQRPVEPEQAGRPPEQAARPDPALAARPDPREEARNARRERRAKREAEQAARTAAASTAAKERDAARKDGDRRGRVTPARIDAASQRGKDALPLGSVTPMQPALEPATSDPGPAQAEAVRPATAPAPDGATRADPVPQVTPAPAETPVGSSATPEAAQGSDDRSSDAPAAEPASPSVSEPPPRPPISN